jgi:probable phosphoglycerate mutase
MQGWAPVSLNETGRKQAEAAGRWLAERYAFDRGVASDLARTRETAEILTEAMGDDGLAVSFEPAWRERDLGVYQGLSYEAMKAEHPEYGRTETAYRATEIVPEGGESFRDVEARVLDRFESLAGDEETVLVVTHGGPLRILLGHAKGQKLSTALVEHSPRNCGVTEFVVDEGVEIVREDAAARTSQ